MAQSYPPPDAADRADLGEPDPKTRLARCLRATAAVAVRPALPAERDALLRSVAQALVADFGADAGEIWLSDPTVDDPARRSVVRVATANDARALPPDGGPPPEVVEAIRARLPVARAEPAATVAVPLPTSDDVLGALFWCAEDPASAEVEALLATFGVVVADALDDIRTLEREQAARGAAETAERRAAFLADASAVLAAAGDEAAILDELAALAVPRIADWCVFDLVDAVGRFSRPVVAHADPAKAAWARALRARYPVDPARPGLVTRVLETGVSALQAEITDEMLVRTARDAEHLAILRGGDIRASMIVPLIARGTVLGAITLVAAGTAGPDGADRRYDEHDLALAEDLARRAALALDSARLYRAELEARLAAEHATDRVARLQRVTAALSEAVTPDQVAAVVVDEGVAALGASAGSIAMLAADGATLELAGAIGYDEGIVAPWRRFSTGASVPLADAVRSGEAIWIGSPGDLADHYPELAATVATGSTALAAVPLLTDGRAIGALGLTFDRPQAFAEPDRAFARSLAAQCAQALERARLYEVERASRASAVAAQQRSAFLAEATARLAASLDYDETLTSVAHLTVPRLADWCLVDLIEEDGSLRRVTVATDHTQANLAAALQRHPPDPSRATGIAKVLRTGRPELVPEVGDDFLRAVARDDAHLDSLRQMGYRSYIGVPLLARNRVLGGLSFVAGRSGRRYGPTDLAVAEEVARLAALAIDNARLYREAHAATDRLGHQAARSAALAEASRAFADARLELSQTLATVARQTAEILGDGCIIRLVADDGTWFLPAAVYHPDPDALALLTDLLTATKHRVDEGLVGQVAAAGQPLLLASPAPDDLRARLKPAFWPYLDRFGIGTALVVPLIAGKTVIGTVFTWRAARDRPYQQDDLAFLQDLADRATLAIENARFLREQIRARDRIQRLAAEREAVLGNIADGVIIADADGRIVFVNDAASRLHGVAALDVPVEDYAATYHLLTLDGDPYPPSELPLARAVLHGETTVDAQWRIRRPDETEIIAQGSAAPVIADDGARLGAVLTLRDITAQREFERQKDEFIVAASHDLKTPLTAIKGWAQMLHGRAVADPARRREVAGLAAVVDRAEAMQRLIDQMLAASRLQPGQERELRPQALDLVALVHRLVAGRVSPGTRHAFRVANDAAGKGGSEAVVVRSDPDALAQIVNHLLDNAVKFSPTGGAVELSVVRAEGVARLTVRDQGIGIPPEALPRVFERFYRAANVVGATATGWIEGLGLGLFSAQQLAQRQGGRIEASSRLGAGSVFTLILPLDPAADADGGGGTGRDPEVGSGA